MSLDRISDETLEALISAETVCLAEDIEAGAPEPIIRFGRANISALTELKNFRALYPAVRFKRAMVTPYGPIREQ